MGKRNRDPANHREEERLRYQRNRAQICARIRRRRAEDVAAALERERLSRQKHVLAHRAYNEGWRRRNLDKQRIMAKRWRDVHPDRSAAASKRWREKNPSANAASTAARTAREQKAMPIWADRSAIKAVYMDCPPGWHVDHVVPLGSEKRYATTIDGYPVCGLHVSWNLQIIPLIANKRKGTIMTADDHLYCDKPVDPVTLRTILLM